MHVAAISRQSNGIQQQMKWEVEAAKELNIPWKTRIYIPATANDGSLANHNQNTFKRLIIWLKQRSTVYREILNNSNQYDVLLLRYSVHDPFLISMLLRKPKPIILVHHTIERKELVLDGTILGKIRSFAETMLGGIANKLADGQLAVTKEILRSTSKNSRNSSFQGIYPNGIENVDLVDDARGEKPEFLFVASSFQPWHGLDKLIDAVTTSTADISIHIVGNLNNEQVLACNEDGRFILHGLKEPTEIREIAARCNLGISSLAMERAGLSQGSTLKTREYLSYGLPVVADHSDVFPTSWPYFKKISTEKSNLISEMVSFSKETESYSRTIVHSQAMPYIQKQQILKNLYSQIDVYFSK